MYIVGVCSSSLRSSQEQGYIDLACLGCIGEVVSSIRSERVNRRSEGNGVVFEVNVAGGYAKYNVH